MEGSDNIIWFSALLEERFPVIFNDIIKALADAELNYALLDHTSDIWCRDFMPVRRKDGKYLLFNYDPSYLKPDCQHLKTPRESIIRICEHLELDFIDRKDIKLDGGNVICSSDSVIMTDAVFRENEAGKNKKKQAELLWKLTECFDSEIIIIPHQPYDILGHADGIVRFLDDKTVLVNDFSSVTNKKLIESPSYINSLFGSLGSKGLNIIQVPYYPQEGKTKDSLLVASGIYINYLETEETVFLPQFGGNLEATDAEALDQFTKLFEPKEKAVVPVRCTDLAKEGGGVLNCVSWN